MLRFCTYFDAKYVSRFVAMYRSLERTCGGGYSVYVLALDARSREILEAMALTRCVVIPLELLEAEEPDLLAVKATRSSVEYFFTLTPLWIRHCWLQLADRQVLFYADADLFFFSNPHVLLGEMEGRSILIIPHRFPRRARYEERNGIFNVGLLGFRRDNAAERCLAWWSARCLEWCYDRHENSRFGDQKYLDDWPVLFENVCVSTNIGANAAPWNVEQYAVTHDAGGVKLDGKALVFYHFQGYQRVAKFLADPGITVRGVRLTNCVVRHILQPYMGAMVSAEAELARLGWIGGNSDGSARHLQTASASGWSWVFMFRLWLEGKVLCWFAGRGWYFDSEWMRSFVRRYDGIRRRLKVGGSRR